MTELKSMTSSQFLRFREVMHGRTRPSTARDRCSCGSTVTCPMLLDEIWGVISNGDRFLCWPCAESRLGREIKIEDLGVCYERLLKARGVRALVMAWVPLVRANDSPTALGVSIASTLRLRGRTQ